MSFVRTEIYILQYTYFMFKFECKLAYQVEILLDLCEKYNFQQYFVRSRPLLPRDVFHKREQPAFSSC